MQEYNKNLETKGKDEIQNMFKWIKKTRKSNALDEHKSNGHCNNFSSHCCLDCDRCWGKR